jgi:hypothetical protein
MNAPKKSNAALLALTATALALPGYSGKAEAWADPDALASYRFSAYRESALPADKVSGTDGSRYSVNSHQFQLLMPYSEQLDYGVDAIVETMSGASPWFVLPDANGKPVQVMSGATIEDTRADVQLHARQYQQDARQTASIGVNKERDYLSGNLGLEGEWDFNQQRTTLSSGLGYSHDQLKPTDGESTRFPNRIGKASKDVVTAYGGFSQVLGKLTVVQLGLNYTFSKGYLSDPYKLAYVVSLANTVPDSRPDRRNEFAVTARLRQYLPVLNAAVHLDYRYFKDDWGISSDTLELSWYQNLPGQWKLVPALRYYEQGYADFYRPYYATENGQGLYSSDYRLSAYGALSYRLELSKEWRKLSVSLSGERYQSRPGYAIHKVDPATANPGLVDFSVLSLSLGYRF